MREYMGTVKHSWEEHWGWPVIGCFSLLRALPEFAWGLIVEMIDRAPSDQSLSFLAASPLEDLLSEYGPSFIVRVEERAAQTPNFIVPSECFAAWA